MSIEWSVRVNRAFTLRDLLTRATVILCEILGRPGSAELVVSAQSEFLPDGVHAPIGAQMFTELYDPSISRVGFGSVEFQIAAQAIEGGCSFGLAEFIPRSDDPESGLFAYVTSGRTPGSHVLSIAILIAVSDCADGVILDDANLFGMGRLVGPDELRANLPVLNSGIQLSSAISLVLANVGLAY